MDLEKLLDLKPKYTQKKLVVLKILNGGPLMVPHVNKLQLMILKSGWNQFTMLLIHSEELLISLLLLNLSNLIKKPQLLEISEL